MKENTAVTGGKTDIARLLWKEIHIGNQTVKPFRGRLYLEGQLNVFVIYETEEEKHAGTVDGRGDCHFRGYIDIPGFERGWWRRSHRYP